LLLEINPRNQPILVSAEVEDRSASRCIVRVAETLLYIDLVPPFSFPRHCEESLKRFARRGVFFGELRGDCFADDLHDRCSHIREYLSRGLVYGEFINHAAIEGLITILDNVFATDLTSLFTFRPCAADRCCRSIFQSKDEHETGVPLDRSTGGRAA